MRFGSRLLLGLVVLVGFPLIAVPSACVVRDEDEDEWDDDDEGDDDDQKSDGAAKGGPRVPASPGAAGAGAESDAAEPDANVAVDATPSDAAPDPFANPCAYGLHPYLAPSCAAKANSRCFDSVTLACLCQCGTEPCQIRVPCSEPSPASVHPWECAPVVSCGHPVDAGNEDDGGGNVVDASLSDAPAPVPSGADSGGGKFRIPRKPPPSGG
jgi:hypothetical protein